MDTETYSRKRWKLIPLNLFWALFGIKDPSQGTDPSKARLTVSSSDDSGTGRPSLDGHVISWPVPVGPQLPDATHSIVDPEPWIIAIPELVGADRRHELHDHLRKATAFHFGLLYWLFRDWGYSVEETKVNVQQLARRSSFAVEVSYEGAMQDMRDVFPTLYGFDHETFRASKTAENIAAQLSKEQRNHIVADYQRKLESLCVGLQQARRFEMMVNHLRTENVAKNKIPDPRAFMKRITDYISKPVSPQQLVDIALLGRVNPRQLWPHFQHVSDLLDLLVFAGNRSMGFSTPAEPEVGDLFRRDVLGQGRRTPSKAEARGDRAWFADAAATVFKRPALAQAVQDLRIA